MIVMTTDALSSGKHVQTVQLYCTTPKIRFNHDKAHQVLQLPTL